MQRYAIKVEMPKIIDRFVKIISLRKIFRQKTYKMFAYYDFMCTFAT